MPIILIILLSNNKSKPRRHTHHEVRTEPFPFFNLPLLVIEKIVKEYIPVKDKMETLMEIPEFRQLLTRKSLWYPSTICSYQQLCEIKPGWYLYTYDLHSLRYYDVDFEKLMITMFYFDIRKKNTRVLVDMEFKKSDRKITSIGINNIQTSYTWVNEVCVYEYNSCSLPSPIFFWIFPKKKLIRWPQNKMFDSGVHIMIDNQCHIFDQKLHPHHIKLTYEKKQKNVTLRCAYALKETCRNWGTKLEPLQFQLCRERGPSPFKRCTSCERGPNFVHPKFKETCKNIESETAETQDTMYLQENYFQ